MFHNVPARDLVFILCMLRLAAHHWSAVTYGITPGHSELWFDGVRTLRAIFSYRAGVLADSCREQFRETLYSHSKALGRSMSRDPAARLVPAVLARSGDDRGGLALSKSTRTRVAAPSGRAGRPSVFVTPRPARRVPPSASLATDHSGRAAPSRALGASGSPISVPDIRRLSRLSDPRRTWLWVRTN